MSDISIPGGWHLKGMVFETCRQNGHCALWFGRDLTGVACSNFATFDIREGHIGGIDMAGTKLIQCGDGIGPTQEDLNDGIKEGAVYISENVSDEQRKVLEPFIKNHLGTELWRELLGLKYVPINITENDGSYHIMYPFGESQMSVVIGRDGTTPTILENAFAYNYAVPFLNYRLANTWAWSYDDYGKHYSFRHTSGSIGDFDVQGEK